MAATGTALVTGASLGVGTASGGGAAHAAARTIVRRSTPSRIGLTLWGDHVRFVSAGPGAANATAAGYDSGMLANGASWSHTFTADRRLHSLCACSECVRRRILACDAMEAHEWPAVTYGFLVGAVGSLIVLVLLLQFSVVDELPGDAWLLAPCSVVGAITALATLLLVRRS